MNSLHTDYIPNVLRHTNTLNALKLIYAHVSNVESHMNSERNVVYFCPNFSKIRETKTKLLYLQVATLGLSSSPLPAPALPPVLPPAQGDQPRHGDLLPGRHR